MFRYEDTGALSKPSESQRRVVVQARHVTYVHSNGLVTTGWEVVKEMILSPDNQDKIPACESVGSKTVQVELPVKRKKKEDLVEEE